MTIWVVSGPSFCVYENVSREWKEWEERGLLLSPRATLMPISDLVDFEKDEGGGSGVRQNVFSKYIRVSVAWGCMSLYRHNQSDSFVP